MDNMELSNIFLNKMEQLNKLAKRLGEYNIRGWAENQLKLKKINPMEFDEIDVFYEMRNILAHGFSGRVVIFQEDIDKLNNYLKRLNKELGFELSDEDLGIQSSVKEIKEEKQVIKPVESTKKTYKTGNGKKANKQEIIEYIKKTLEDAKKRGQSYVVLRAGDVEKAVGLSQRIASVCSAMYECMKPGDEVLSTTNSGKSTTVKVKYYL